MEVLWRSLLGLQAWSCRARTISGWWQCYCGFSFPEASSPLIAHWTHFPRSFKLAVGICLFVPLLVSLLGSLKPLPLGKGLLWWRQTLNPPCAFWEEGLRSWQGIFHTKLLHSTSSPPSMDMEVLKEEFITMPCLGPSVHPATLGVSSAEVPVRCDRLGIRILLSFYFPLQGHAAKKVSTA